MPDTTNADTLMSSLRAHLETFKEVLAECITSSTVHEIPLYEDGRVPDYINPVPINGDTATASAIHALGNFSRQQFQHPGSVFRLPGVIHSDKNLVKSVNSINLKKEALKTFIQTEYPDPRARNRFCVREFPGRVMLQVYRKIYIATDVEAVSFTWSPFTESIKNITRKEALELLHTARRAGTYDNHEGRLAALEIAIEEVERSAADTQYSIRKRRSPYPIANLYQTRGKAAQKTVVPASLPLILCTRSAVEVGKLRAFDVKKRSETRSDKQKMRLIFKPGYLYAAE